MFDNKPTLRLRWLFTIVATFGVLWTLSACSDDVDGTGEGTRQPPEQSDECPSGQQWNPVSEACVAVDGTEDAGVANGGTSDDIGGGGDSDSDDVDSGAEDGGNGETVTPCEGLECEQVSCPGTQTTSITGTVHIPSGELPLPDVSVYVPNTPVEPLDEGASCVPCGDELSAEPVVEDSTNIHGHFSLNDAPVGEEVPLVVEVGKWRRQLTVEVNECQQNALDPELTRLPRNQEEGDLPKMAVTTGGWDALECLIKKIGVDRAEFSTEEGDGRVNLFAGHGGSNRFSDSLNDGAEFTTAWDWWDDLDNLLDYDIVLHSCEGSANLNDKSQQARDALYDFTLAGGRVFLSHWHNAWLEHGPAPFQSVANWDSGMASLNDPETGFIDTTFDKGEMLYDWMGQYSSAPTGQFPVHEPRATVGSIDNDRAQQWVWAEPDPPPITFPGMPETPDEVVQYFSFNTPLEVPPEQQCGRVVFSDIHVSPDESSSPENPFPDDSCTADGLSPQEKALVFMLFDLSRCIVPDGKKGDP